MYRTTYRTALFAVALGLGTMAQPALADTASPPPAPAASAAPVTSDDWKSAYERLELRVKQLEEAHAGSPQGAAPPAPGAPAPAASQPAGATAGATQVESNGSITPGQRQQLPAPAEPANMVRSGAFPGSFMLPGTKTSVGIHGWISLQGFYDPNQYLGDKFQAGSILPSGNAQKQTEGTWHLQGKLTRIIFETRTPTSMGLFKTYWASDFYGYEPGGSTGQQAIQNNNYGLRVVHAYGTLGGFLAGKTWSNFIDDPDSLESLDNAGAAGVPSEQVLQVRYTRHTKIGDFSVSGENPVTDIATNDKAGVTESTSKYNPVPDFTAKYEIQRPWGHAQLSGVLRTLAYDDGNGHRSTAEGGGGIAGATFTMPRNSALGAQVWFGNGIMKFTPDDFGPVSSAQINNVGTAQQTLVGSNENGLTIYAAHEFSPQLRSNLGFGYNNMHWNDFIPADVSQPVITHTLHANVIWSPVPMADFGLEYIHGLKTFRQTLNLPETSVDRYETAFKFRF